MKRKPKKGKSTVQPMILTHREDRYVLIKECSPHERGALLKIEKRFGAANFTSSAASRIGIDRSLLRDLTRFKFVERVSDDQYAINRDARSHESKFETEVPYLQSTSAMFTKSDDQVLKSRQEISRAVRETETPEKKQEKLKKFKLLHVIKRFRMPYDLYLLVRPRVDNMSAYIRCLIYKDLGMKKEAELEKSRMGKRKKK